jgi:hypothetical protein
LLSVWSPVDGATGLDADAARAAGSPGVWVVTGARPVHGRRFTGGLNSTVGSGAGF